MHAASRNQSPIGIHLYSKAQGRPLERNSPIADCTLNQASNRYGWRLAFKRIPFPSNQVASLAMARPRPSFDR
jgi:hypothetical protein